MLPTFSRFLCVNWLLFCLEFHHQVKFPLTIQVYYIYNLLFLIVLYDLANAWWEKQQKEKSVHEHRTKKRGPTQIWTGVAGFKVQSANRYTIEPLVASFGQLRFMSYSTQVYLVYISLYTDSRGIFFQDHD